MTTGKRKAHHPYETKLDMVVRLNKIGGQIRGILKMIDEDIYCDDIFDQFLSVNAAINSVRKTLFETHIKSCVVDQIQKGRLQIIDEFMITVGKITR